MNTSSEPCVAPAVTPAQAVPLGGSLSGRQEDLERLSAGRSETSA